MSNCKRSNSVDKRYDNKVSFILIFFKCQKFAVQKFLSSNITRTRTALLLSKLASYFEIFLFIFMCPRIVSLKRHYSRFFFNGFSFGISKITYSVCWQ
jgi:hypothetical protein